MQNLTYLLSEHPITEDGSDFDNPTADDRKKIPTIGAILDGADDVPTPSSNGLVKSGGVFCGIDNAMRATVGRLFLQWEQGGYLLPNNSIGRDVNYAYTPYYYPVKAGDTLICKILAIGSADNILLYDLEKNVIQIINSATLDEFFINIEQDGYIRFSNSLRYNPNPYVEINIQDSIQDEVNSIQDEVNSIQKEVIQPIDIKYILPEVKQGILNKITGRPGYEDDESQHPNYKYCPKYFLVNPNGKIKVKGYCSGSYAGVIFYDENKNVVGSNVGGNDVEIDVPATAYYVRICSEYYNTTGLGLVSYGNIDNTPVNGSRNIVTSDGIKSYVDSRVDNIQRKRIDINPDSLLIGLFKATNGEIFLTSDNRYRYCPDYFEVDEGSTIVSSAYATGSAIGIAYYDSEKNFISGITSTGTDGAVIPDGVYFARFCSEKYQNTGLEAKIIYRDYLDPKTDDLDERVTILEEAGAHKESDKKPFFNIGYDTWVADEETKTFYPLTQKIRHDYKGEVNPEKRYIALGFDDFRASDFSFIIPLLDKYEAKAEFNRVHRSTATPSLEDVQRMNSIINSDHEIGDHTWLHFKFPFDEPLFNGQDPSNPDGNQVPFPSNDQLRSDRGDGKNVFGKTLTNNVKSDCGYQAPEIDTTWAAMTDAQCQEFRDYYSLIGDVTGNATGTVSNLITILDTLSNTYLGTTGSSRGSWDNTSGEYTGGIFTGCKTSQNHEVWERILLVTNMFLKDKFGLNYNLMTWSLPGSKSSGCYFPYSDGYSYYDAEHTKKRGNLARFTSSIYKDNNNIPKERSWTDVLREFGYKTTHDASPTSRDYCMAYQFIMNGQQSRPDALPHPTNRLLSYSKIASEYTKGTDLTGSRPYEVQMYDGGYNSDKNSFRNELEQWRHSAANGIIWGAVIDSNDTWSERMILEGLLKYGIKTGIEFITHAEAYDICFNHTIKNGNLIYNPRLRNTAKEFMPTATTIPSNPDGYIGDCSVSMIDGTPVLVTSGETDYKHYGIPYGKIKYSADVKGSGSIVIRAIKNNTRISSIKTSSILLDTITVNNNDFASATSELTIPDNGINTYDDVFGGYGDKIIGLVIIYSSGLEVKNADLRVV